MIYSYKRISSSVQKKGHGLARQSNTELLKRLSVEYNLPISDEVFSDEGRSAFHGDHLDNELGRFLDAVKTGKVRKGSLLVIESLDRLSRQSTSKAQLLLLSILESGINIYTGIDDKLYSSDDKDLAATLIVSVIYFARANDESRTKSMRTKAAQKNAIDRFLAGERCIIPTGKNPSWVVVNEQRNGFDLIPAKQQTFQRLSELYISGKGMVTVVRQLHEEGFEPITKAHNATVYQRLIKSPMLYGDKPYKLEDREILLPGYYPAVIDKDIWLKLQHQRTKRPRQRGKTDGVKLLTGIGITKCGYCGSSIVSHGKNTLICRTKTTGILKRCVKGTVNQKLLEDAVLNSVNDCKGLLFKPQEDETTQQKIKLTEELEQINGRIERLIDLASKVDGDSDALSTQLSQLESQKKSLEARIENVEINSQKKAPTLDDWKPYLDSKSSDRQRLRELIQDTFKSIKIYCIGKWLDVDTVEEMVDSQDEYRESKIARVDIEAQNGDSYRISIDKDSKRYHIYYQPKGSDEFLVPQTWDVDDWVTP